MKTKYCWNCGHHMDYNIEEGRFRCNNCGNADPSAEELKTKTNSYIN